MAARNANRRGFTLVELAIVLVIIGLLIGGILTAQSMISTSKLAAQVAQIQQFDAGVMNFMTKYDALPGDARAFGGPGVGYVGAGANMVFFGGGIANLWNNIDSTQFPGTCPYALSSGCQANISGINKNVPAARIGKVGSFFIGSALCSAGSAIAPYKHYYALLDPMQAQTLTPDALGVSRYTFNTSLNNFRSVKPVELFALDVKMDDGNGNTGDVLSGAIGSYGPTNTGSIEAPYPWSWNTPLCYDPVTGYSTLNTFMCVPLIRMGAQTGDPQ